MISIKIRKESKDDWDSVHAINVAAFSRSEEANLVDVLRKDVTPLISLVAEEGDLIVGHALFSPIQLPNFSTLLIMGLGPVAVLPEKQNLGIGSSLIRAGLDECRKTGIGAVVVLGHHDYYPRFGFVRAKEFGISCAWAQDDNSFMLIELKQDYLKGASGLVKYAEAFDGV